ncbi:hypothetical protein CAPTEDRAFT_166954 [Capitella teleta]|uniref:uS12 prolyl 3-hydroxylase n=1 Tax=Capitella teleta TaxID=283909 RepID=R7UCC2_CAPTE|nr:hypothetical protein CAPTEDRAFT_166954 [Capitella teleta]|eukprot:ELU03649.1 hypothetical protein CAPTEDRAFT_166954 [Capitella teleta]
MEKGKRGKSRSKKITLPYSAKLNEEYLSSDFKTEFKGAFVKKEPLKHENGSTLHNDPFQCAVVPSFLQDTQILDGLKEELLDQIFFDKNNDLYKFQQSDDLKTISTPHVKAIRKFFCDDVAKWLREVTGIPLSQQVDLTCSRYDYTDTLLCHDDELDTRRIAFILYLVPPWKEADGGSLDLFDVDEHGQPRNIVKSIFPSFNSFAWFEVTEVSHHQVSEVLSQDKTRLSVNGWFHAPPVPRADRYVEPQLPLISPCDIEVMYEWINPVYLEADVQGRIQEKFENDSEIELQGFLQEEKYHELLEALLNEELNWNKNGVPNKRFVNCLRLEDPAADNVPAVIRECQQLFRSEAMFLTLSNLTGLSFHPLAVTHSDSDGSDSESEEATKAKDDAASDSGSDKGIKRKRRKLSASADGKKTNASNAKDEPAAVKAKCRYEVRKWEQGCYTLMHDTDLQGQEYALDVMLFCGCKGWKPEYGGSVSYIAKGEDEELLTVSPAENSLALVYRDKETLRFVKHINHQIIKLPQASFFDVSFVYYE